MPYIKQLIANGDDVNDRCYNGTESPLYYAATRAEPHIIETLVNASAMIDAKTTEGETALFGAIWHAYKYWNIYNTTSYQQRAVNTIVELMKFGASIETAKACKSIISSRQKSFQAGLQHDSIKAAITKGLQFQK